MIYNVTSGKTVYGKAKEAEQWLLKIVAYLNEKNPGINAQLLRNTDGQVNQLHIKETYDSLGTMETANEALQEDADWQALLAEGEGLSVQDSIETHYYRVVS